MKNYKYAVETRVYDNGIIKMSNPFKVDWFLDSYKKYKKYGKYDYYFDVFPTLKDAKSYLEDISSR